VEGFGDFLDVLLLAPEGEGGRTGGHFEAGNLGPVVDDLFGQAVAEVILLLIGAHIGEGQDGDGWRLSFAGLGGLGESFS